MAEASAHRYLRALDGFEPGLRRGRITRVMPTFLEADGPTAPLGSICAVGHEPSVWAEIVQVTRGRVTLAPFGGHRALVGDAVTLLRSGDSVGVGPGLLGRAVDAFGRAIDGAGALVDVNAQWPLAGSAVAALDKVTPQTVLPTGVRAIDALLTLGVGQRIGVFAGSGVGKTTLLSTLVRNVDCDACVLCLVGERGREAQELWHGTLDAATRRRSVLVAATSDEAASVRARAVPLAVAIAEYLRAQGRHVLLVVDSITRYALALREIGLAAGEPVALRGYPPSVFAALPRVVERCGAVRGQGAITAVFSVLTESEDIDDAMAETMRSLLDGHLVLSRALAEEGHYPAVDVTRSISRVMARLVEPVARMHAQAALADLARCQQARLQIDAGLYRAGADPALDQALARRPALLEFLRQDVTPVARAQAMTRLAGIFEGVHA